MAIRLLLPARKADAPEGRAAVTDFFTAPNCCWAAPVNVTFITSVPRSCRWVHTHVLDDHTYRPGRPGDPAPVEPGCSVSGTAGRRTDRAGIRGPRTHH